MPVSAADLDRLGQELSEPIGTRHDQSIEILVNHLRHSLPRNIQPRIEIARIVRGGSLHKNTAIRKHFDCDLVMLFRMAFRDFCTESEQKRLKQSLLKSLELEGLEVDPAASEHPHPSASCTFHGIKFDVLVGASQIGGGGRKDWSRKQLEDVQGYVLRRGYWKSVEAARSLSASASESAVKIICAETEILRRTVVLLKQWRDFHELPKLKSFVLELIALEAAYQLRSRGSKVHTCRRLFVQCMDILDLSEVTARDPRILTLEHLGLYDPHAWRDLIFDPEQTLYLVRRHRLHILNPMTPNLCVLFSVPCQALQAWSDAACQTRSMMEHSRTRVVDVFGVGL
eukprot:CAMPEP_0179223744 /NCGR_PEP_ID=MMETSP0797-20121207/7407_1 /TAXON_ID=47934 /ORGANISM="Dinophysis acuminata, Strain DAEP01" /LENGTH=341 /DNA_ID=CAMNT_0020930653 /DNA_START=28 /DNA_END=1053 /DNA_ORIENTATION=+